MIKSLIKFLQKFDKETYTDDLPKKTSQKEEPRIEITGFQINPKNPSEGAFAFDWNTAFIDSLRMKGYTGDKEEDLVEQWFSDVCRNIVLETYEQEKARLGEMPEFDDPNFRYPGLIQRKDLGNNRSEFQ